MTLLLALFATSCTLGLQAHAQAQDTPPAEPAPQEPSAAAEAPAVAVLELSSDIRAEYLHRAPMLVRLSVTNSGGAKGSFPDLKARPHLVHFEFVDERGKKVVYRNTAPSSDTNTQWSLGPRGRKQVLLEIPQSQTLKPGAYTLTVRIKDPAGEKALDPVKLQVVPVRPQAGELTFEPLGAKRGGHQVVWLQDGEQGYDVYLHHADAKDPVRELADYHLAHLEQPATPVLALAQPGQRWDRHVYWQRDARSLQVVRLDGQANASAPKVIQTPYPKIEVMGRGVSDGDGGLHIPVWIPAPKGSGGELMVISLRDGGTRSYRSLSRYDQRPAWLETGVDSGGNLRVVLPNDGNLDQYTVLSATELPGAGKRLVDVKVTPTPPLAASYGVIPAAQGQSGGLGLFALLETAEPGVAQGVWFSLDGKQVAQGPKLPLGPGSVQDVLPMGRDDFAVLMLQEDGSSVLVQPGLTPLPVEKLDRPALVSDGEVIWVRGFQDDGPIMSKRLR